MKNFTRNFTLVILVLGCLLLGFFWGRKTSPAGKVEVSPSPPIASLAQARGLTLSSKQQEIAGLKVSETSSQPVPSGFQATGSLVAPPTHLLTVKSQIQGVVESVNVQVGEQVKRGQVLTVLKSQEAAQAQSAYHQASVELQLARDSLANTQKLVNLDDLTRRPVEQARQEVSAAQSQLETSRSLELSTQNTLSRLEKLLEIGISSQQQIDQARSTWEAAKASRNQAERDLKVAQSYFARQTKIQNQDLKATTEIAPARARIQAAEERLASARSALEVLGSDTGREGRVTVTAPFSGVIQQQQVALGETVMMNQAMFELLDPSLLWLWIEVYETDIPALKTGQNVRLSVTAYPDRDFEGTVTYIDPSLDPTSRTSKAQVKILNPSGVLSPGMPAVVEVLTRTDDRQVVLPKDAVVRIQDQDSVYVEIEPGFFERRTVEVARTWSGKVAISGGLEPRERVVVQGAYYLKSEDLKSSLEDDDE